MTPEERIAATRLAAKLRTQGRNVTLMLHPEKARTFFSFASANASEAVYIGPDDRAAGSAKLKTLATRKEDDILID